MQRRISIRYDMNYSEFSAGDFAKDEYFQRWIHSESDENVAMFWNAWLLEHPEKRAEIDGARKILSGFQFSPYRLNDQEVTQLWNKIHQLEPSNTPASRQWRGAWASAAAAILLCVLSALYFYNTQQPWKSYHTNFGETRTITLPDGSSVVLNANSNLTLRTNWREDPAREIWLEGEAFFSVVHQSDNQLFKVHTLEGVTVEVLGTTFNVYNRTQETKVVLNTGQIRLNIPAQNKPETIFMKPGDMVEYKEQHYKKKAVDPKLYSAWTDNRIMLNHTSLGDMIRMLEDNYGMEVVVREKALLDQTVSGSMPLGNPDILLQQLAKAFRLKITKEHSTIIIEEL